MMWLLYVNAGGAAALAAGLLAKAARTLLRSSHTPFTRSGGR